MWEDSSDHCQRCGQIGPRSAVANGAWRMRTMAGRRKKTVRTGKITLNSVAKTLNLMWKGKMGQQGNKIISFSVGIRNYLLLCKVM